MCQREWIVASCVLSLIAVGVPATAVAQSTSGRWEVEVHGGGGFDRMGTDGQSALPPAGPAFTTAVGLPSRRASTWYFGDGALLLNQINASFTNPVVAISPITGRMTPLDPVLQSAAATRGSGGSVGFRVARAVTPRLGVEFTLDAAQGKVRFTDDALAGIEASRATFIAALDARTGLLTSGGGIVFTNAVVTSTAAIDEPSGRQLFTTGALTINLARRGRLLPYAAIGAGVVTNVGDPPSVTLTGNYRFSSLGAVVGTFPVDETDTVRVRLVSVNRHPLAIVFGGGVKYQTSGRWGLRGDVRAYVSKNTVDVLVDATPRVVTTSTPLGIIASTLTPSIQFTNLPSVAQSTLSGPAIDGFRTFSSSGTSVHVSVTAGYFVRF
jgi:hypothetical protein